jgi:hypothetical protein
MRHVALQLTLLSIIGLAIIAGPVLATAPGYDDANVSGYNTDAELESAGEIESAIENGTATPAEVVLIGDSLIVAIDSERLAEEVDEANGSTTTERFFAVLDGDPELLIRQTNPLQKYGPKVFQLGPANTTVYRSGDTAYAVIETGEINVERPDYNGSVDAEIDRGDVYQIRFGTDLSTTREEGSEFRTVRVEAEFDDIESVAVYDPLAPDIVNRIVEAYIEPMEDAVVTLTLGSGETRSERIAVPELDSSNWIHETRVEFDLRDVEPGTDFTLELVHDGAVVDRRNGTVREPEATLSDVRFVEVDGQAHLNLTANLSHGGKVMTVTADGERLASIDVEPGEATNLSIPVVYYGDVLVPEGGRVLAVRTDGPEPNYYPDAGQAIGDGGVQRPTPTPTPTVTPTPSPAPSTATPTTATPSSPVDQPGFGIAGILAAFAVATLALLARHRSGTG